MKIQLESVLFIAQGIIGKSKTPGDFLHPIFKYINAIGSSVLQKRLMQLFTGQGVTPVEEMLIDFGRTIKSENNEYFYNSVTIEDKKISISLKDNLVIPVAWERNRFIDNLTGIGADCGNPFKFQELNYRLILFLPIGVTIVYNGNHSILSGIIKREGIIYPTEMVNLAPLYEKIIFDGTYYRNIENNQAIQKVKDFELGAIYEIGRLLIKNGITYPH
nr:DUF6710 family protein [Clostridium indicum]